MKNEQKEKDFFLIAKKLTKQSQSINDIEYQLNQRLQKESQQALKMINAYRKVQNIKGNQTSQSKIGKQQKINTQNTHQPKSTYANKIKQTLRQLNANKAKQYEKLSQKNAEISSSKNINSLQVINQMGFKAKSENQKKLLTKSTQKFYNIFQNMQKRLQKQSFLLILKQSETNLSQDYKMAKKYRIFRLFSLWKEQTYILKRQNQKKRKQLSQKQIEGDQLARQFFIFKTYRKVIKSWLKLTKNEKKRRQYEQEIKKSQIQNQKKKQQKDSIPILTTETAPLQNKLKGFLDGLKQKIQHKDEKPKLKSIQEKQQSQRESQVFSQNHHEELNNNIQQFNQNQQFPNDQQDLSNQDPNASPSQPQKPLSNEQLQKKRQQIYQRSKNRKQALQKLKKEKQLIKKKQQQQRKQLQKRIQQEQKRIKQLKYKQFHERKRLEKEWELRQVQLNVRAEQWNKIRLIKYYGFEQWKHIRLINVQKAQKIHKTLNKIMIKHAGQQLFEILQENLQSVLFKLYQKIDFIHQRNLKRKALKGYKIQRSQCIEQKIHLLSFHQVHTQKIYFSSWKSVMDVLRLQNLQEQRPLIKKANDYHKVSLMLKSLRQLKKNAIESKKQKNITEQKLKIKSKIKDIIKEKIQINFQQFL